MGSHTPHTQGPFHGDYEIAFDKKSLDVDYTGWHPVWHCWLPALPHFVLSLCQDLWWWQDVSQAGGSGGSGRTISCGSLLVSFQKKGNKIMLEIKTTDYIFL